MSLYELALPQTAAELKFFESGGAGEKTFVHKSCLPRKKIKNKIKHNLYEMLLRSPMAPIAQLKASAKAGAGHAQQQVEQGGADPYFKGHAPSGHDLEALESEIGQGEQRGQG